MFITFLEKKKKESIHAVKREGSVWGKVDLTSLYVHSPAGGGGGIQTVKREKKIQSGGSFIPKGIVSTPTRNFHGFVREENNGRRRVPSAWY